jgi:hypothetical protein
MPSFGGRSPASTIPLPLRPWRGVACDAREKINDVRLFPEAKIGNSFLYPYALYDVLMSWANQ